MDGVSLLTGVLPETVAVDGVRYGVRTDFRVGLRFDGLLWDRRVSPGMKVALGVGLFFGEGERPGDAVAAFEAVTGFYRGGETGVAEGARGGRRLVDFEKDAGLVYAAFLGQYGVDLMEARMHWWVFRALFAGLSAEQEIVRVMAVRGANPAQAQGGAERAALARMQARVRLEDGEGLWERAGAVFAGV